MKITPNVVTPEEIAQLKEFWTNKQDRIYVNWQEGDDNVIDHRLLLNSQDPEFAIIRRIVEADFPNAKHIWSALQRQNRAHHIHIDDYSKNSPDPTWTYVIALDTIPEFRTIVWKEKCYDNDKLHEYVAKWGEERHQRQRLSNISEVEDLEHTYDENQGDYIADYLTLDGIFSYEQGSTVLFETVQLHCTSNWRKYPQHTIRELLQIHVTP